MKPKQSAALLTNNN
jgi:hypothetical protein